ncbi:MAG: cysteine desulfurase, SufS family protein [Actinomycetota bacterium]|jgi:cysteine desulfurase/selenocysteine lyase
MKLDVAKIREDFPIYNREIRSGQRLVYLDSGATSQKPRMVLDAERAFYENHNAAAHRGAHQLAEEATSAYESARETVANFIGANSNQIVFTKSATESLNLLAYTIKLSPGDEVLVTEMEHHANLIPWQQACLRSGAKLRWISVSSNGRLDHSNLNELINSKTKIVAITHQSNVLGTINELEPIVSAAKKVNAKVVLDACQSVPHIGVDVNKLGVDYLVFSAHKMLGLLGTGVLWGADLNSLPPFIFGGSMIESVTMTEATWSDAPTRFEGGVPNVAGAVALAAAINYLEKIGIKNIHSHEVALTKELIVGLQTIDGIEIFGPTDLANRGGTVSFTLTGIHPHDLGQFLDDKGIAVRTGHHCAWPLAKKFNLTATTRASLYLYNDYDDIAALLSGIEAAKEFFK